MTTKALTTKDAEMQWMEDQAKRGEIRALVVSIGVACILLLALFGY